MAASTEVLAFQRIKSVEDFNTALQQSSAAGKTVMLDFYADWCTYCIKMEDNTFSDARVQQALSNVTVLQADVTANDAADQALLKRFDVFGPPTIIFFDYNGKEIIRIDSVVQYYRLWGVLDYVNKEAYLTEPDYQAWRLKQRKTGESG